MYVNYNTVHIYNLFNKSIKIIIVYKYDQMR